MLSKKNYISLIRKAIGKRKIILNYAAGVLFDKKRRILLQKRADNNKWGLPGGIVEVDESFEEAVVREFWEETGLRVAVTGFIGCYSDPSFSFFYPNKDAVRPVLVVFYVRKLGKSKRVKKCDETLAIKYFEKGKLPAINTKDFEAAIKDAFMRRNGVFK